MLPAAGRAPLGLACPSLASASVDVILEGHSEHEWSGDSQLPRTLHPTCSAHSGLSYAWPSAWPTGWRGGGEAARPQAGPSLMAEAGQGWGERAVGWPPESQTSVPPRPQKLSPGVRRAGSRSACPPLSPRHRLPGLGPQEDAACGLRGAAQHRAEARPAAAACLRPHPRRSVRGLGEVPVRATGSSRPSRGAPSPPRHSVASSLTS